MPRYKEANYAQGQFVSIQFEHQNLPGSFEHALSYVIDHKINMTAFDVLRKNDAVGAPAYDPRVMLKIVLAAYARGMISSRDIAFDCERNVIFIALSARSEPHFTTIAQFIRGMGPVIKGLFVDVLLYCDELGLIGREMFAIDGCKISSNASKEWSGRKEDFEKKKAKFSKLVETLVAKHKKVDAGKQALPAEMRAKEEKAIKALEKKIATLDEWLKTQEDKIGHTGLREANMKMLEGKNINGYVADRNMRKRDPAYATANRHGEKIVGIQGTPPPQRRFFGPDDFKINEGWKVYKFEGRHRPPAVVNATTGMIQKIDSALGRFIYSRRMGLIEPVFGHIRHALGLDRFTLKGNKKVNIQWKLYNTVHNLLKIFRYGWITAMVPSGLRAMAG